jgi:hypothetical protein
MQWFTNRFYTHQYYKITSEGEQKSIYDTCKESYILHIHNDHHVLKYHFLTHESDYELKHPYTLSKLSIHIENQTYDLHPYSFIIQGNRLFDRPILRWLCIHYLGIPPVDTCKITCVDKSTIVLCSQLDIHTSLEKDIK